MIEDSTPPVYEVVQHRIEALIASGDVQGGEKLPSERALAQRFGVSRNSVREAIRCLTEKNLLESRRGDGTYLRHEIETASAQPLTHVLRAKSRRLKEIFEFRRMLEPNIAALAARRITPGEVDALKMLVFDQEKRHLYGEDDAELDAAFHSRIALAAGNSLIVEVLKTLDNIIGESRSPELQNEIRQKVSMRTHYLIVDALEKGDPVAAEQAMTLHLREVETAILEEEQMQLTCRAFPCPGVLAPGRYEEKT